MPLVRNARLLRDFGPGGTDAVLNTDAGRAVEDRSPGTFKIAFCLRRVRKYVTKPPMESSHLAFDLHTAGPSNNFRPVAGRLMRHSLPERASDERFQRDA